MTDIEKVEFLKDTIEILYSEEGRSFSYISRLLKIGRHIISKKVKEWGLKENTSVKHLTPSNQKWLNAHREQLVSALRDDEISIKDMAGQLGISYDKLLRLIKQDDILSLENKARKNRLAQKAEERKLAHDAKMSDAPSLDGEIWSEILGYDGYQVSNMGRVRSCQFGHWTILTPTRNIKSQRMYISMKDNKGKRHNLLLARLVGFAFCDGYDPDNKNTINHIDGNTDNNKAENLEWVSQGENNLHAYQSLNRSIVSGKRYNFSEIIYKEKYHFKTVAAFARFIGKSETQTRRYMDEPEKYEITFIL